MYNEFLSYIINSKNKTYTPYSNEFNVSALKKLKQKIVRGLNSCDIDEVSKIDNFINMSTLMHDCYKSTYNLISDRLEKLNSNAQVAAATVALLNSNFVNLIKKYKKKRENVKSGNYDFADMSKFKIQSITSSVDYTDAHAVFETLTDTTSNILNYLRYDINKEYKAKTQVSKCCDEIVSINFIMQQFVTFKSVFDHILYTNGYVESRIRSNSYELIFRNIDENQQKLKLASNIIIENRISFCYNKRVKEAPPLADFFKIYRIKKIMDNHEFKYGQGKNKILENLERVYQSVIDAYYPYLEDTILPNIKDLPLKKVITLRIALQYLAIYTSNNIFEKKIIYTKEDRLTFVLPITEKTLVNFLLKITKLKISEIKEILPIFVCDWQKRNDIWFKPIYKIHDTYVIANYPMIEAIEYHIIDQILLEGGINSSIRGQKFENYIYISIKGTTHNFPVMIFPPKKYGEKNDCEEIDGIVVLKNIIIVVEAKYISYPMEAFNYHDSWHRLQQGCKQAKIKSDFIKHHSEYFKILGDYSHKEIYPIVVTNYPVFTGNSHEGVYIIDAHSFIEYINDGTMITQSINGIDNPIVAAKYFYTDEDSMSNNFEKYVRHNPLKEKYMPRIKISEAEICDWGKLKIYESYANFENDPRFNIKNRK